MWGGEGGLTLGSAPPDSCLGDCTKSKGMEATWRGAASPHSGHIEAGSNYQQSEHVAFFRLLYCVSVFILSGKNNGRVQMRALIFCLCHKKTQPASLTILS